LWVTHSYLMVAYGLKSPYYFTILHD